MSNVQPHVLSWLGWSFITGLGAFAMYAEGSFWLAIVVGANALTCLSIVFFSIIKKVEVWKTSKFGRILFMIGILGLVLWVTLSMPILALICAIIADFAFGVPTIIKTYKEPSSETSFVSSKYIL